MVVALKGQWLLWLLLVELLADSYQVWVPLGVCLSFREQVVYIIAFGRWSHHDTL